MVCAFCSKPMDVPLPMDREALLLCSDCRDEKRSHTRDRFDTPDIDLQGVGGRSEDIHPSAQ